MRHTLRSWLRLDVRPVRLVEQFQHTQSEGHQSMVVVGGGGSFTETHRRGRGDTEGRLQALRLHSYLSLFLSVQLKREAR